MRKLLILALLAALSLLLLLGFYFICLTIIFFQRQKIEVSVCHYPGHGRYPFQFMVQFLRCTAADCSWQNTLA